MKVLFTTDGSDCSRYAILEALRLLPNENLEAVVVAVAEQVPVTYGFEGMAPSASMVREKPGVSLQADLKWAVETLATAGVSAEAIEREGEPGRTILEVAAEVSPDVVVLGSHGRNAFERLMLGSVSSHVVHHWPGSTLVIRPRV